MSDLVHMRRPPWRERIRTVTDAAGDELVDRRCAQGFVPQHLATYKESEVTCPDCRATEAEDTLRKLTPASDDPFNGCVACAWRSTRRYPPEGHCPQCGKA